MNRRQLFRRLLGLPLLALAPLPAPATPAPKAAPARRIPIQRAQVAGFQYHQGEAVWPQLQPGAPLRLHREPTNPHDPNAIAIYWGEHKLGYIPRRENKTLAGMLDQGVPLDAAIVELREGWDPWQRVEVEIGLGVSGPASLA
jgi:hypothetical protein